MLCLERSPSGGSQRKLCAYPEERLNSSTQTTSGNGSEYATISAEWLFILLSDRTVTLEFRLLMNVCLIVTSILILLHLVFLQKTVFLPGTLVEVDLITTTLSYRSAIVTRLIIAAIINWLMSLWMSLKQ